MAHCVRQSLLRDGGTERAVLLSNDAVYRPVTRESPFGGLNPFQLVITTLALYRGAIAYVREIASRRTIKFS